MLRLCKGCVDFPQALYILNSCHTTVIEKVIIVISLMQSVIFCITELSSSIITTISLYHNTVARESLWSSNTCPNLLYKEKR